MSKVFIEESTLTAIGDAIRAKDGTTALIAPLDMPNAIEAIQTGSNPVIEALSVTTNGTYNAPTGVDGYNPVVVNVPQDGAPTAEELTFKGDLTNAFSYNVWNWFINKYGNQITTDNVSNLSNTFYNSSNLIDIPFTLKHYNAIANVSMSGTFMGCQKLKTLPPISNFTLTSLSATFQNCRALKEIPDDYFDNVIVKIGDASLNNTFYYCYSLRKIHPAIMRAHDNHSGTLYYNYSIYQTFSSLYALDELVELPTYKNLTSGWTSNAMANLGFRCGRLKRITFETQSDGTPYTTKMSGMTLLLTQVGYSTTAVDITNYSANSGVAVDKRIIDDATYQSFKDDNDSWTTDANYSFYNHDKAVETINTLPDTSAFVAEKNRTNTITFKGAAGALTDGGAINTLTEEEIAVATAKGWTVSFQ